MTPIDEYLIKAKQNEYLVDHLKNECSTNPLYYEWILVVIYYTAIHYFNALLLSKGFSKLPSMHVKRPGSSDLGRVELAKKHLWTSKNGIQDDAGTEFEQLYRMSKTVRYELNSKQLLGIKHIDLALTSLIGIKVVTFNETGKVPQYHQGKIRSRTAKIGYLNIIYKERQEALKIP